LQLSASRQHSPLVVLDLVYLLDLASSNMLNVTSVAVRTSLVINYGGYKGARENVDRRCGRLWASLGVLGGGATGSAIDKTAAPGVVSSVPTTGCLARHLLSIATRGPVSHLWSTRCPSIHFAVLICKESLLEGAFLRDSSCKSRNPYIDVDAGSSRDRSTSKGKR